MKTAAWLEMERLNHEADVREVERRTGQPQAPVVEAPVEPEPPAILSREMFYGLEAFELALAYWKRGQQQPPPPEAYAKPSIEQGRAQVTEMFAAIAKQNDA